MILKAKNFLSIMHFSDDLVKKSMFRVGKEFKNPALETRGVLPSVCPLSDSVTAIHTWTYG